MTNIVELNRENQDCIPSLVELVQGELPRLKEHYPPERLRLHLETMTSDYFRAISESDGKPIFPIAQGPSSRKVYLALADNRNLNGMLLATRYQDEDLKIAEILWVLARVKGTGIGTALINKFIEDTKISKDKPDIIGLSVSSTNIGAKRLYGRMGFSYFGPRQDVPNMDLYSIRL